MEIRLKPERKLSVKIISIAVAELIHQKPTSTLWGYPCIYRTEAVTRKIAYVSSLNETTSYSLRFNKLWMLFHLSSNSLSNCSQTLMLKPPINFYLRVNVRERIAASKRDAEAAVVCSDIRQVGAVVLFWRRFPMCCKATPIFAPSVPAVWPRPWNLTMLNLMITQRKGRGTNTMEHEIDRQLWFLVIPWLNI